MSNFLHLVIDSIFIDKTIERFNAHENIIKHDFVYIWSNKKIDYIKSNKLQICEANDIICKLCNGYYAAIICHSLNNDFFHIINNSPRSVRIWWIGWGYDYYCYMKKRYPNGLILAHTLKLHKSMEKITFKCYLMKIKHRFAKFNKKISKDFSRIDFFSPVIENEFDLLREELPSLRAKYLKWNYSALDLCCNQELKVIPGPVFKNILLGNSASPTNNHVEMLDLLRNLDLSKIDKVICPLSYGDRVYSQKISLLGKSILGKKFVPLLDMLPTDKYSSMLSECRLGIFGYIRQQGVGNILELLMLGKLVFLDRRNPCFEFFSVRGCSVYSLDDIASINIANIDNMPDEKIIQNNINACAEFIDESPIYEKTLNAITCVLQSGNKLT